jgi:hypothetical protein
MRELAMSVDGTPLIFTNARETQLARDVLTLCTALEHSNKTRENTLRLFAPGALAFSMSIDQQLAETQEK